MPKKEVAQAITNLKKSLLDAGVADAEIDATIEDLESQIERELPDEEEGDEEDEK